MNKFEADIQEVRSILLALYAGAEEAQGASDALQKLTAPMEEAFLAQRAQALKTAFAEDQTLQGPLARLWEEGCAKEDCGACPLGKYCNTNIQTLRRQVDPMAPTMLDLFCGAGGLSLGFTQEGFAVSLANDIEPCCIDTYAHNHPEIPRENIILGDIREVVEGLEQHMRFRDADIIVGGPPCQGFSMANRQRLIEDPRNALYKNYVRAVELVKPKFFVMENVKGMMSVASQVMEDFEAIGYRVSCRVLNAKDFGVPQNRERLIYIGNRVEADNEAIFKEICQRAEEIPSHVLADALEGLRPLEASRVKNDTESSTPMSGGKIEKNTQTGGNDYLTFINQGRRSPLVFNHKARYNNDRDIEIFGRLYQGDRSDDPKIADIMPYARRNDIFKDKYFKLEAGKVCKTITAHMKFDCNMYIHPTQARGLTPREAARVQSYPDDYFFRGAYTKTYMQIGNAVPPLLGRAIAAVLKRYL